MDKKSSLSFLPSREEMLAQIETSAKARLDYRNSVDTENTFCPVDLGDWLDLCRKAKVAFIPAEKIAEVDCEDVVRFDEEGDHQERVTPFWNAVEARQAIALENAKNRRYEMLRWSCCSCMDVKYYLGDGKPEWNPEFVTNFHIGDIRAFDIVMDFPKPRIAAFARPWWPLMIHESYPVEFRAFVENNKIVGISSYYPQRQLPFTERVMGYLSEVRNHTEALILEQWKPLNCPELKKSAPHLDIAKNSWTADFAVSDLGQGQVLFLEGGPAHTPTFGAHPCCFPVGEIEGIALRPRKGMAGDVARAIASGENQR